MLHTRSGSTSCDSKFSGVIPRVAIRTLVRTSMQGIDLFLEANVLKCNIWSGYRATANGAYNYLEYLLKDRYSGVFVNC
jgi:hypothetical protein